MRAMYDLAFLSVVDDRVLAKVHDLARLFANFQDGRPGS